MSELAPNKCCCDDGLLPHRARCQPCQKRLHHHCTDTVKADITEQLTKQFRVRDWWPGMDSFDSARGETVPHPVAAEAAKVIKVLREDRDLLVRVVREFSGESDDAAVAYRFDAPGAWLYERLLDILRGSPSGSSGGSG